MQHRLIALLAGALALLSPLMSHDVQAEQLVAQALPGLEKVQITAQQKAKLAEARTQMQSEINRVLTNEQRDRYKSVLGKGGGVQQAIAAMNITSDQQTRMQKVIDAYKTQVEGILTAEQLRQIRENVGK